MANRLEGYERPTQPAKDADALQPLRSVHTENFPIILSEINSSLAVTTYQAGKLVFLRPQNGKLNTHFRTFDSPMGLAVNHQTLSIGTPGHISHFRKMPAVA